MVWFLSSSNNSNNNKYMPFHSVWSRRNKRGLINIIRWLVITILFILFSFLVICRLELNARLYIRQWITPSRPVQKEPLSSTCFGNLTHDTSKPPKTYTYNFVPGIPVWEEYTCYDYASLLQPLPLSSSPVMTTFHTTWSSQNSEQLTSAHLATFQSFCATQPLNSSQLILWIHPDDEDKLKTDPLWKKARNDKVRYQVYTENLTVGTPLEQQTTSTIMSDLELVKLAVLYHHGGIWFDLNTLFVRDMTPLLGHEWIAQGNCQSSMSGNPFDNTGLMHFYSKSSSICELLSGSTKPFNNNKNKIANAIFSPGSTIKARGTRGPELYQRIYHNLLRNGVKPWSTLPWCFTNPSQCKSSNSLPSPFVQANFSPLRLRQIFAFHFSSPPRKQQAPSGSIYRYLEQYQQW